MSERSANIARLFVKLQSGRDRAWKAHIGKKTRQALEEVCALEMAAMDLRNLLAEEEEVRLKAAG